VNLAPIRKVGMLWVVGRHARLKSRYTGIVDHYVSHRNDPGQPRPLPLIAHVERFEPTPHLGSSSSP
jgi:hypothetical protein